MSTSARVLCFGKDKPLVETRGKVLQHAGFLLTLATNLDEYEALLRDTEFDLVVLCHSLSLNECESAAQYVHQVQPYARTLVLKAMKRGCSDSFIEETIEALRGPHALINKIQEMLYVS